MGSPLHKAIMRRFRKGDGDDELAALRSKPARAADLSIPEDARVSVPPQFLPSGRTSAATPPTSSTIISSKTVPAGSPYNRSIGSAAAILPAQSTARSTQPALDREPQQTSTATGGLQCASLLFGADHSPLGVYDPTMPPPSSVPTHHALDEALRQIEEGMDLDAIAEYQYEVGPSSRTARSMKGQNDNEDGVSWSVVSSALPPVAEASKPASLSQGTNVNGLPLAAYLKTATPVFSETSAATSVPSFPPAPAVTPAISSSLSTRQGQAPAGSQARSAAVGGSAFPSPPQKRQPPNMLGNPRRALSREGTPATVESSNRSLFSHDIYSVGGSAKGKSLSGTVGGPPTNNTRRLSAALESGRSSVAVSPTPESSPAVAQPPAPAVVKTTFIGASGAVIFCPECKTCIHLDEAILQQQVKSRDDVHCPRCGASQRDDSALRAIEALEAEEARAFREAVTAWRQEGTTSSTTAATSGHELLDRRNGGSREGSTRIGGGPAKHAMSSGTSTAMVTTNRPSKPSQMRLPKPIYFLHLWSKLEEM